MARPDRIKTNQTDSGHSFKSHSKKILTLSRKSRESIMATSSVSRVSAKPAAASSLLSTLKAYFIPFILFSTSLFYQLIVIPRAFPRSHYDGDSTLCLIHHNSVSRMRSTFFSFLELIGLILVVLGVRAHSSIEEVNQAYEKLSSKWYPLFTGILMLIIGQVLDYLFLPVSISFMFQH